MNGSGGNPDVAELTNLAGYLFFDGPAPPVLEAANVDGQGGVNVADLTYLVGFLFFEGSEPICGPIEWRTRNLWRIPLKKSNGHPYECRGGGFLLRNFAFFGGEPEAKSARCMIISKYFRGVQM